MTELNWIVPCRRAVVRQRCDYRTLISRWRECLAEHRAALESWYLRPWGAGGNIEWGLNGVPVDWIAGGTHAAGPGQGHTVDGVPFAVRLWKGPYRVLYVQDDSGLGLNARGEVGNPGAEFLPGDLIEFPLHKFLAWCLPRSASSLRGRLVQLQFNGAGSPFLGTTMIGPDGLPAGDLALHDNMLAMRFQLLLNLGIAAFSSPEEVYTQRAFARPKGLLGEVEGEKVYARGMMYGATFVTNWQWPDPDDPPTERERRGHPSNPHWQIATYNWGVYQVTDDGRRTSRAVPDEDSYRNVLLPNQPLTPAWGCSPCTLTTSFFLRNEPRSGAQGVTYETETAAQHWARRTNAYRREHPEHERDERDGRLHAALNGIHFRKTERPEFLGDRSEEEVVPVYLIPPSGEEPRPGVNPPPDTWRAGDLHVAGLYGHELAFVRIYPPSRLTDSSERPYTGFLSAYNPVTGEDYLTDARFYESGQLWRFEAAGIDNPGNPTRMGAGPHKWEPLDNNILYFIKTAETNRRGRGLHGIRYANPRTSRRGTVVEADRPSQSFNRLFAMDLNDTALRRDGSRVYQAGNLYPPLAVLCYIRDENGWTSRMQVIRAAEDPNHFMTLYAQWAVPFPTLREWQDWSHYPPVGELESIITSTPTQPATSEDGAAPAPAQGGG